MFDSSIGGPAATSYISVEDATAILVSLPQSGAVQAWQSLTEQQKEQSLNGATMVLDPLAWKGQQCSCEQRLAWPRQLAGCGCPPATCGSIPFDIQLACAYLAAEVGADGGGFVGSASASTGSASDLNAYKEVVVGPLRVVMRDNETSQTATNFDRLPAFVADLLKTYLAGIGGITQVALTRSSTARIRHGLPAATAWSGTMQFAWTHDGQRVVKPRPENGGWASFQAETSEGGGYGV